MADIFDKINPSHTDAIPTATLNPSDKGIETSNLGGDIFDKINPQDNNGGEVTYPEQRPDIFSQFGRFIMRTNPIEQAETASYMQDKMPQVMPNERYADYQKRVNRVLKPRERQIENQGVIRQIEVPMQGAIAASAAVNPGETVKSLAKFVLIDAAANALGASPENIEKIKNPELRAAAEVAKFGAEGVMASINPLAIPRVRQAMINKSASVYRDVLAPSKWEIGKVEVKQGKDLNDYYKLAAEEGLVIKSSPDKKLDTADARAQLQDKTSQLNQKVSDMLQQPEDQKTYFDLDKIGDAAKNSLRDRTKNDVDYEALASQVDKEIGAAKTNRGNSIDAPELNTVKQGMWSKSYNPLEPNSKDAARAIGFAAKDAIEKAFPDKNIREINKKLGDYLTLDTLLENAHGRVIQKGKIGRYAAQGIGALAGHAVGLPVVGELGGGWLGGVASDFINSPKRITSNLANKLERSKQGLFPIINQSKGADANSTQPIQPGITPEIVDNAPPLIKPQGNIAFNPLNPITRTDRMLPSPKTAGSSSGPVIYGKDWGVPSEDPYGFLAEAKKAYFGKKPFKTPSSYDIENATPIAYGENGPTLSIKDTVKMIKQDALSGGKKDLALKADELLRRLEAKEKSNQIVSEFNPLKSQAKGSEVGDSLNKSKLILPAALGGALLMQKESEASKPISEGQELRGKASTYGWGEKLNPYTFSGERFNTNAKTVAMRGVPMGTKVEITDNKTGNKVIATVNDGGPGKRLNRLIDLSKGAWKELGYGKPGLLDVSVKIVSVGKGRAYNGKY